MDIVNDGGVTRVQIESTESGPDAPGANVPDPVDEKQVADGAPVKPDWCPDKFWKDGAVDQEGMAKSYGELEKGKPAEKAADPLAVKPPVPTPSNIPGVTAEQTAQFTKELQEGEGALSAKSYADLEAAGYSKATVDAYIGGIKAQQAAGESLVSDMKAKVGGDEKYAAMAAWMMADLKPAEISAYNAAVNSGNRATVELAIDGMNAKFTKAMGSDPKLIQGKQVGQNNGDVYASSKQIANDMKTAKYKTDPAEQERVRAKIARSAV